MRGFLRILRSVAAILLGYILMSFLITLVQEVWLDGVSWRTSSMGVLVLAGFLTFLSAAAGGFVAGLIAVSGALFHALVMCLLVLIETTYLVVNGKADGPLWFDALASASLMFGILLGALFYARMKARKELSKQDLGFKS